MIISDNKVPQISYKHRHIATDTHKFIHVYSYEYDFFFLSADIRRPADRVPSARPPRGRGGWVPPQKPLKPRKPLKPQKPN